MGCSACGDNETHQDCWLMRKLREQESLPPPEEPVFLETGRAPEDLNLPEKVKLVSLFPG